LTLLPTLSYSPFSYTQVTSDRHATPLPSLLPFATPSYPSSVTPQPSFRRT
jgi:hypothetical protein